MPGRASHSHRPWPDSLSPHRHRLLFEMRGADGPAAEARCVTGCLCERLMLRRTRDQARHWTLRLRLSRVQRPGGFWSDTRGASYDTQATLARMQAEAAELELGCDRLLPRSSDVLVVCVFTAACPGACSLDSRTSTCTRNSRHLVRNIAIVCWRLDTAVHTVPILVFHACPLVSPIKWSGNDGGLVSHRHCCQQPLSCVLVTQPLSDFQPPPRRRKSSFAICWSLPCQYSKQGGF